MMEEQPVVKPLQMELEQMALEMALAKMVMKEAKSMDDLGMRIEKVSRKELRARVNEEIRHEIGREILVGDCGPSPIEDIPVIEPDDSPLMRMYKEAKQKAFVTDTSQMEREHQVDALRYTCGGIANFMGPTKEEGNMPTVGMSASEPREMWSIYQVIAIEKENCGEGIPKIDTKVVAKNAEHAKGLAGVNTMLERNNFDNTKITVICDRLATVKPVKDDE